MNIFFSSLLSAWSNALLSFLWQGALIGIAAALLLRFSRQAKPQIRYAIACMALALCFTLPIASVWRSLSIDASADVSFSEVQTVAHVGADMNAAMSVNTISELMNNQMPWLVIVWSLGCAFFSLRMAMGLSWIASARRDASKNTDASLQSKLNLLAIQFGLQGRIDLLICNVIDSPVTVGWWKPVVFVPAALATRLPPDYIEALLAHELAHIKRFDYLVNLIQSFVEAVLFFHPVVWWLSKQIRIERENIADDLAAEILGEPRQLAVALAALDEFQFTGPLLAPAAHGGNLMSRIQRLMKPTQHVLNWKMSAALIGLTLACIGVYAHDKTPTTRSIEAAATAMMVIAAADATDAVEVGEVAEATAADAETAFADADSDAAAEAKVEAADKAGEENIRFHGSSRTTFNNDKKYQQSYAVVTAGKEGFMLSGSTDDIGAVQKARKKVNGDFLWFSRNGKAYIVQDPEIIAQVKSAWRDSDKISAEMELLGAKMEVHSNVMNSISTKMQAVSEGSQSQSSAMEKISRDMELIGSQQEAIGRQMGLLGENMSVAKTDSQRNALDQKMQLQSEKMAVLDSKMQELQALMNKQSTQLDRSLQPLDALSKEMDIAAKPLEPLSKQMEVLGKKLEVLTKVADEKVATIIDETVKSGQALPVGKVTAQ